MPDAKLDPPHRELREPVGDVPSPKRLCGERHAVVGADGLWQPAALEELLKDQNGAALLHRRQGLNAKHEARVGVVDRKRVAVDAIKRLELALEVFCPDLVRRDSS